MNSPAPLPGGERSPFDRINGGRAYRRRDPELLGQYADRQVPPTAPTTSCPGRGSSARTSRGGSRQTPRILVGLSPDGDRRGPPAPFRIRSDVNLIWLPGVVGLKVLSARVHPRRGALDQDGPDAAAPPIGELPTDLDYTGNWPEGSWRIGRSSRSSKSATTPIRVARPWWGRDARFRLEWRTGGSGLLHRPKRPGLPRLCVGSLFAGAPARAAATG